jgi:penicillin-binding protein 2
MMTIDGGLQDTLDAALNRMIEHLHVPGGAAVALDPRTGEVLALVSRPSFDPNIFTTGATPDTIQAIFSDPRQPLFFRAVSGTYPSGSSIKPVVAAAGLTEGVITPQTTVLSTGGIQVGPNFFPDWKKGGHGVTDVRRALAESINTFFYYVGGGFENFVGLGVDRLVHYFQIFGLGAKLGIDVPNEAAGFIPTSDWRQRSDAPHWYLGDTYHLTIGQGYISVTPLQVASYTAAVANGGKLFKPYLVRSILNPDGSVAKEMKPELIRMTVDDRFLSVVREGMRQAVTTGSAKALNDLPVAVAAKTGTAQFGSENKTHAWLTAFAPYNNPEIAITVLVESGGEGGFAALPVAKEGLAWYFQHHT